MQKPCKKSLIIALAAASVASLSAAKAHWSTSQAAPQENSQAVGQELSSWQDDGSWLPQPEEIDLPEWLIASLHVRTVYQTGAEEGSTEGVPADGWTVQSIEPGLAIEWGDGYRLMGIAHIFGSIDGEGDWDIELDEATFDTPWLPWDGTLRLGQMRTPWGLHNDMHQHAWWFVEQNLMHARYFGDEGLNVRGARADWRWDRIGSSTTLSIGGGQSVEHNHAHGAHSHGGDDHGGHDHGGDDHDEHGEITWDGPLGSLRVAQSWMPGNNTTYTLGVSGLVGEQESGEIGQLYGIDLGWSKEFDSIDRLSINLEAGAHRFYAMAHDDHDEHHDDHDDHDEHDEHHDDHGHDHDDHAEHDHDDHHGHDDHDDHGGGDWYWEPAVSAVAVAQINQHLDLACRAEWIGGIDEAERPERWRISPALTWYPDEDRNFSVRTQYSYETGSSFDEHRFMVQLGFSWGDL